jgi:dienelactone hydrolase
MSRLLTPVDERVVIASRGFELPGHLSVPEGVRGLVVFAQDVGANARTAHDRHVATRLCELGLGTLQFDLCARQELEAGSPMVDLDVLAVRLLVATRWLRQHTSAREGTVGYFGAHLGAAVALLAAAEDPSIGAVVVRSADTDLIVPALAAVRAPTLLIVGGGDSTTRDSNEAASTAMTCERELVVVPQAGNAFQEPGMFETSTRLAAAWFLQHLRPPEGDELA